MLRRLTRFVALSLMAGLISAGRAQQPEPQKLPDAKAVLEKTRQVYHGLKSYHFEHQLVVEGQKEHNREKQKAQEKPSVLARVSFVTLTDLSDGAERGEDHTPRTPLPPPNTDRCRLEARGQESGVLLVGGGGKCWLYETVRKEYMRGKDIVDVAPSVGSALLLGLHVTPFEILSPKAVKDAKVTRREKIALGKQQRECIVLEGTLQPRPEVDPSRPPSADEPRGVDSYLFALGWNGLLKDEYHSDLTPEGEVVKNPELARFALWIDAESFAVLRVEISAKVTKFTMKLEGDKVTASSTEALRIRLTDTFQVAELNPKLPEDLFRFTPPKDAKEIPNIRTPRGDRDK
jgi:hypothetical protein